VQHVGLVTVVAPAGRAGNKQRPDVACGARTWRISPASNPARSVLRAGRQRKAQDTAGCWLQAHQQPELPGAAEQPGCSPGVCNRAHP
jgi:hypothetical protein